MFLKYLIMIKFENLKKRENIILWIIIGIGALLRLTLLGQHRFHGDESLYAAWAIQMVKGKFMLVSKPYLLYKPPVYLIIAGIFYVLMPFNEIFAEIPNILADTASIFLIYKITMKLYKNREKAFLSALIFALIPVNILFSATAFLDTMMVTMFLLSFYFLIESKYFLFGLFYALSIMTKQFAVFYIVLIFLYIIYRTIWKKDFNIRKFLYLSLAGFIAGAILPVLWGIRNSIYAGHDWYFALFAWMGITDQHVIYTFSISDFFQRFKIWMYYYNLVFVNKIISMLMLAMIIGSFVKNTALRIRDKYFGQDIVLITALLILILLTTVSHMPIYNRYIVTFVPLSSAVYRKFYNKYFQH